MKFSLIIATIGRTSELIRLFESLVRQSYSDFEIIVVDQNQDSRIAPIVAEFADKAEIRHVRLETPGVSKARNVGVGLATGHVLCFPDDDCWYTNEFLETVARLFSYNPDWDAIIGEVVDESSRPLLPWRDSSRRMGKALCWRRALCVACILRPYVLAQVGGFDESRGGGANTVSPSGEDNDLMLRVIERGFHVRYENSLYIHHPRIFPSFDEDGRLKRYKYALGDGALLRKHPMPFWWRFLFFAVPAARMIVAMFKLARNEVRFHWATFVGRVRGFWASSEGSKART
jgi:glycosyltransferase involved in cell wall biosynthesis